MGVSKNNGTPKSSILVGFSIINHPFWGTPILGNARVYLQFGAFSFVKAWSSNAKVLGFEADTSQVLGTSVPVPKEWSAHPSNLEEYYDGIVRLQIWYITYIYIYYIIYRYIHTNIYSLRRYVYITIADCLFNVMTNIVCSEVNLSLEFVLAK